MSYEKVKSIKIDEEKGKVFFNTASNNVRPLTYSIFSDSKFYNNLLKEEGKEEVEIEILKEYECGNLQQGNNKYTNALKVLYYVFKEEYKDFNWRNNNFKYGSEESLKFDERRKSKEFKDLLRKCLNYKIPKKSFVITKNNYGEDIYAKVCLSCIKWLYTPEKATKFHFEEEAKDNIYTKFKDVWKVKSIDDWKRKQVIKTLKENN